MPAWITNNIKNDNQDYLKNFKRFGSRSSLKFCWPDMCPNYLQILSTDGTRKQRVDGSIVQFILLFPLVVSAMAWPYTHFNGF